MDSSVLLRANSPPRRSLQQAVSVPADPPPPYGPETASESCVRGRGRSTAPFQITSLSQSGATREGLYPTLRRHGTHNNPFGRGANVNRGRPLEQKTAVPFLQGQSDPVCW